MKQIFKSVEVWKRPTNHSFPHFHRPFLFYDIYDFFLRKEGELKITHKLSISLNNSDSITKIFDSTIYLDKI